MDVLKFTPRRHGKPQKIEDEKLTSSSKPSSLNMTSAKAVDRLLNFYGPLDVGDPGAFTAGLVVIFGKYPPAVIEKAIDPVRGIPGRCKVLRLAAIKEILDEINGPFQREIIRQWQREKAARSLPAPDRPRTPEEQARIDEQVHLWRHSVGIPEKGLPRRSIVKRQGCF